MFAVASLMLVGALIVFALTATPVQAAKKTQYCTTNPLNAEPQCFNGKGKCENYRKSLFPLVVGPCKEQPV